MTSWDDITKAVGGAAVGRSNAARQALQECWDQTNPDDHAQRCIIAHYLADQQDDLEAETRWDETALSEHAHVTDADLKPVGVPSVAGFAPSLHLNLGDDYLRGGNTHAARTHLDAARAAEHLLPDAGYGAMIRGGINSLAGRLDPSS
ncbi:hypothetical protein [Corynebacterium variabile]|uniref:hypothetical protein n=1 Tax=Corynebacterium variabile TaxID=1727 RepID=UPI002FE38D72